MADSSFSRTSEQFQEAFEELYVQSSRQTRLDKPLGMTTSKPAAPRGPQSGNGVRIKALFDIMKERNSSICSDLNSSIVTASSASFGDADMQNQTITYRQHPREKEKQTPERNHNQTDCLPDNGSLSSLPQSPAMRVALNFARHAARLDGLPEASFSSMSSDRSTQDTRLAVPIVAEIDKNSTHSRQLASQPSKKILPREIFKTSAQLLTRPHTRSRHLLNSSDVEKEHERTLDKTTEEICSAQTIEVTSTQNERSGSAAVAPSATVVLNSATASPVNKLSDESHADQETLQLVSKLIQRLNSSAKDSSDDDDDSDNACQPSSTLFRENIAAKTAESAKTTQRQCDRSKKTKDGTTYAQITNRTVQTFTKISNDNTKSKSVINDKAASSENLRHMALPSTKRNTRQSHKIDVDPKQTSTTLPSTKYNTRQNKIEVDPKQTCTTKYNTRKQQKTDPKVTCTRTLRSQRKGAADTNSSSEGETVENKVVKKDCVVKSCQKKQTAGEDNRDKAVATRQQNSDDSVEADIIPRRGMKQVDGAKDLFSLEVDCGDGELQVEQDISLPDAVAFASKKSLLNTSSKPTQSKGGKPQKVAESTSHASRTTQKASAAVSKGGEDKSKILKLSSWSLQPVARLKGVRIEGKLPNTEYFWLSSVIVERVSSRVLKSTNGSLYRLVGNMSVLNTRAAGFSEEITQLFKRGFPADWKTLVESSVKAAERNSCAKQTGTLPTYHKANDRLDQNVADRKVAPQGKSTPVPKANSRPGQGPANKKAAQRGPQTPVHKRKKKPEDSSIFHTPALQTGNNSLVRSSEIWTPQGVMARTLDSNAVRRTQSGRCVIPRLAGWAGQYVERDDQGNIKIGFASLAAEKHFAQIAEHEMHVPSRLRNSVLTTSFKVRTIKDSNKLSSRPQKRPDHGSAASSKQEKSAKTSQDAVKNTGIQYSKTSQHVTKNTESKKRGKKESRARKSFFSIVSTEETDREDVSLEQEVMDLVHNSKEMRLKKGAQRNTCYSGAADTVKRSKTKSQVFMLTSSSSSSSSSSFFSFSDDDEDFVYPMKSKAKPPSKSGKGSAKNKKETRLKTGTQPSFSLQCKGVENTVQKGRQKAKPSVSVPDHDNKKTTRNRQKTQDRASKKTTQNDADSDDPNPRSSHERVNDGNRTRGKGAGREKKSSQKEDVSSAVTDVDGSHPWSEEEIQNLHRGMESISSDHPQFWAVVSDCVGTRSSKECAAFYLRDKSSKVPSTKAKEVKKKQNDKTLVLNGKRGTLKRRCEMRAILEHDSKTNSQDDLFQATPFMRKKRAKTAAVDFSKTDEEVFGQNPDFFTPRRDGSKVVGGAVSHTPASSRKTPSMGPVISPWVDMDSAHKRDVDQYIFRMKKNRRQLAKAHKRKKSAQFEDKVHGTPCTTTVRLFNRSPVPEGLFQVRDQQSGDEDEVTDYYYSEDEN